MAGTFQDWLVIELRLTGAVTIGQANAVFGQFLPRFNAHFQLPAEQPQTAYGPLAPSLSLAETLCLKHSRRVARDNTVK